MAGPAPHPAREGALAALAAALLAVVLTWPVALHPTAIMVGHPGNDTWNHAWGYWWVADSLASGRWPGHTSLLAWPNGGSLYFIDMVQALSTLPLQWVLGPAFAFNVAMLSGFALAGFGAWLLARRITGDPLAAGLSLVIYESAPHLLGQAYNGISETVCAGWFPLTLWAVVRLLDRPSPGAALRLGVLGGITMLTSWYYGLFAALASLLLVLWPAARQAFAIQWRRTLPALAGALGVAVALVGPVLLSFRASLEAPDALVSRDPNFVERSLLFHNLTDILAFFRPFSRPSPDLLALFGEELVIVIYLGWVVLLLAGVALVATRRRRELAPWLWFAAIFFLFSLGPYLNVGGAYLTLFGRRIPLPFLALFDAVPIFDRISHPFRFATGVELALAMVAAHGLRHLLRRASPGRRLAGVGIAGALVLAEVALSSPSTLPVPTCDARIPDVYTEMAADPVPGAVLDLPMAVPNLERAVYVWYQRAHGRPVPWGLNEPMPRILQENRLTATLIRMEATRAQSLPRRLPELDMVVGALALQAQGLRYLVVHEALYPRFKLEQVRAVLEGVYGEPDVREADRLLVWRIEPKEGPGA